MKVIAAGLPNIRGSVSINANANEPGLPGSEGALYKNYYSTLDAPEGDGAKDTEIGINASRYNAIYGASDTVQPPAIALIPQIRY